MSTDKPTRYVDLWRRNRNFRVFFLGQLISFLGDWFTTIALYSAVREMTSSGLAITLVLVCKTLPIFLIAPLAGPLVDRVDRRKLLLFADIGRAACALAFIAIHLSDSLVGLYACTIVSTILAGVAIPAKFAVLPRIVSGRDYPAANAMGSASWAGMLTLGAALGGIVTALVGISLSFVIDAATFMASASFFYLLPPQRPPSTTDDKTGFLEAIAYLRQRPTVVALAAIKTCQTLAGGIFALIPLFGSGVFAEYSGPLWLGVMYSGRGLGTLVGSLWFRVLAGDRRRTMRGALAVAFVSQVGIYFALGHTVSFWQAALCYMLSGAAQGLVWVFSGTLLQAATDERFHGRIFALEFGGMTLTLAVSSLLTGAFVDGGFGPQEVVIMLAPLPLVGALIALYVWKSEQ